MCSWSPPRNRQSDVKFNMTRYFTFYQQELQFPWSASAPTFHPPQQKQSCSTNQRYLFFAMFFDAPFFDFSTFCSFDTFRSHQILFLTSQWHRRMPKSHHHFLFSPTPTHTILTHSAGHPPSYQAAPPRKLNTRKNAFYIHLLLTLGATSPHLALDLLPSAVDPPDKELFISASSTKQFRGITKRD